MSVLIDTGVAREFDPARRFEKGLDDLHEMLYRRGGVGTVNAAIEELTKLLLLQWVAVRHPDVRLSSGDLLSASLAPEMVRAAGTTASVKAAFSEVIALPQVAGRLPDGSTQPLWPLDEPLRLERADVLAEALQLVGDALQEVGADQYDMLGSAFDVFLRGRYDHSGGMATHLTPHTVVDHLAAVALADVDLLAEPLPGPVGGDFCVGTGRFLMGLATHALNTVGDDPQREARYRELLSHGLVGADQSHSSVAKARLNLLLMGADHPQVFAVEDSITDAAIDRLRGQMRVILTNPPFGSGKYDDGEGIARTVRELPSVGRRPRIDPAIAFIARCLELLGEDGRLGIVLPDGVVDGREFKASLLHEGSTRRADVSVESNVSLPPATFALSGTVARTSAVVLRKGGARRGWVFLGRAGHVGYLKQSGARVDDPAGDDLPALTAAVTDAVAQRGSEIHSAIQVSEEPLAAIVPIADLQTLDPSRVDPAAAHARETLRQMGAETLGQVLEAQRRRGVRADGVRPFVSVLHLDDLGAVRWHEAEGNMPTTPGQIANPGEIIVSLLNPSKLRATVIPEEFGPVLCSAEFGVFSCLRDPWEVLVLIQDPLVRAQLAPLGRGTSSSRRRIEPSDLLSTLAPPIDEALPSRGARLRDALAAIRRATLEIADLHRESEPRSHRFARVDLEAPGTPAAAPELALFPPAA